MQAQGRATYSFPCFICLHVTASVTENNVHIYQRLFLHRALLEGPTFFKVHLNFGIFKK